MFLIRDRLRELPDSRFAEDAYARLVIRERGYYCDVEAPGLFLRTYCANEGLDFEREIQAAKSRFTSLLSEAPRFPSFHDLLVKLAFFEVIIGRETNFLQVTTQGDGKPHILLDVDPMPMPGRVSWLTVDLKALFERLQPFVGRDFVFRATDYLKDHAEGSAE
ncbi:hypothetical protein [Rhodobacter lacus]|uniref:hypothetical protein n=1 Tax=Rhodobacter lacus TaxID=1641972 RepID=UPI0036709FD9